MKKLLKYLLGTCLFVSLSYSLGAAVNFTEPLETTINAFYGPIKLIFFGSGLIGASLFLRKRAIR